MQTAGILLIALFILLMICAGSALVVTRRRNPGRWAYWTAPWAWHPGESPRPQYRRSGARR